MKQTIDQIVTLMVLLGIASIQAFAKPFAVGPYLGQTPPGPIAKVFAPGLICDTRPHQWETWGSFSADGNTFCFYRRWYVYITENTDHGWTVPKRIKSIPYKTAGYCYLSADANSIYFIHMDHPSIPYNLCRCQRTSDGWSTRQELGPPLSSPEYELGISLAANNNIYFGSRRKYHKIWIWSAPFMDNIWTRADRIILNHPHGGDPGIAPDESFMVFTAIRPGGLGETDLYLSLRQPDGTWGKARNLGPKINSGHFEFGARISPDKKYMFFTRSNGWFENSSRDTSDIYWVELKEYLPESHR
jgi:hypothetical protein